MGKLTNMVAKESSFGNRVKYNARRIRFAGIGLFGKLDQERTRLYQQIVEKGNGNSEDGVVAALNAFGSGVVTLAREESQRVFDELVEAGEVIAKKSSAVPTASVKPASPAVLKAVESPAVKKASTAKPVLKPVSKPASKSASNTNTVKKAAPKKASESKAKRKKKEELVAEETLTAFGDAKQRVKALTTAPDQAEQLALYALFKQGEEGDVKGRRPAMAKIEERAKFDARRELKGMSRTEAIEKYVAKVDALMG